MTDLLKTICRQCEFRSVDRCRVANRPIAAMQECPLAADGTMREPGDGETMRPGDGETMRPGDGERGPVLETDRIAREVTIGISAFRRPEAVLRQVESIRRLYPSTKILIVDNGDRPADVSRFANVDYVTLAFDAGLSACRNEMLRRLRTPYLLLCDDDYVWTAETDVGTLLDVLDADPAIGEVAGGLIEPSHRRRRVRTWAQELVRTGERIESRPLRTPWRRAPAGAWYRLTDTAINFALFRRQMLTDHPYDEELKINEHLEWSWRVKAAGRWRIAICETVLARHERSLPEAYRPFRRRQDDFNAIAYRKLGIRENAAMVWSDPRLFARGGAFGDRPNVIVLTIGNTGSTPVTQMARALGWQCPDADETYCESVAFREINSADAFDDLRAREFLARLPQPWVLKDPRFVKTCGSWLPLLSAYRPLLLYVTRQRSDVMGSRVRRGQDPDQAATWYDDRDRRAVRIYEAWPWRRWQLDFEDVCRAAAIIDENRPPRADHVN